MLTIHRSKGLEFPVVYLPVPVGSDVDRREARPGRVPRPGRRAPRARSTSGSRARPTAAHRAQQLERAARRGPAARLRRADARQAPGGRVVGRLLGRPRLRAEPAAVRARRATATVAAEGAEAGDDAAARARFEELAASAPGCVSVERPPSAGRPVVGRRRGRARRRWPPPTSTAASTASWRRTSYRDITAAAHDARVASEPEEAGRDRRAARSRSRPRRLPARRSARAPLAARGRCRAACTFGTFVHRSWRRSTSPRPTSTASSPRRSPPRGRGVRSRSATRRRSSPGCAPRSRRRSARSPAACGCATSRARTAWTSWPSSCRSPAARRPPGG